MTRQRLTLEELYELVETCRESVFRLEALQEYNVPGDRERYEAFRETRTVPERPTSRSHRITRELVDAGKRLVRVHVVDVPLTSYMEYELAAYSENIDAGEDVRITDRAAHPGLTELTEEFMLIDDETDQPVVVWYDWSSDGQIHGWDRSDDSDDIARCRARRDLAVVHSVPLEEFHAMVRTE